MSSYLLIHLVVQSVALGKVTVNWVMSKMIYSVLFLVVVTVTVKTVIIKLMKPLFQVARCPQAPV